MGLHRQTLALCSGVRRIRGPGGIPGTAPASQFSPLSLSPVLWLKADAGTLKTIGGIAAVNDGDLVGQWLDQSGNGNHVSQATVSLCPTLKLAIQNGLPAVRSDGVDDFLRATFTLAQPFTVAIVSKRLSGAGNGTAWGGVTADVRLIYFAGNAAVEMYAGTESPNVATTPTSWHAYLSVFNGASSSLAIDGGAATTGNPGASNPGGITVAAKNDGSEASNADVGELIVIAGTLTAGQVTNLATYLRARWGTP